MNDVPPLNEQDRIDELLDRWELARQEGHILTAEQLCVATPEHLTAVRDAIQSLQSLSPFIDARTKAADVPQYIGKYRVVDVIASGGMGVVYRCRQTKPHRDIAVKTIHPSRLSIASIDRFREEAELLGRLKHPGIAHIYEVDEAEIAGTMQPYIAMELVAGEPLDVFAQTQNLDADACIRLVIDVCDAVAHAHAEGVVHRDLKPANILANSQHLKVLDFGIAQVVSEVAQPTDSHRDKFEFLGSLAYMSPEQICGQGPIDQRADVYSLGVVLFLMLAKRLPLEVANKSSGEAAQLIAHETAPLLGTLNHQFRGDLEMIVADALKKDPLERYPSVTALADDLKGYLEGVPAAARPVSPLTRLGRRVQRNPAMSSMMAVTVLAVCVGAGMSVYWMSQANDASHEKRVTPPDAETQSRIASDKQREVEQITVLANQRLDALEYEKFDANLLRAQQAARKTPRNALAILNDAKHCPPQLRNFTWKFLRHKLNREVRRMPSGGVVRELCFSPNEDVLTAIGAKGQVQIWDPHVGDRPIERQGPLHRRAANAAFFHAQGCFAACDNEHRVRVFETQNYACLMDLAGHKTQIMSLAISHDDRLIASCDNSGQLIIWDVASRRARNSIQTNHKRFLAMLFTPEGDLLTINRGGSIVAWNPATGASVLQSQLDSTRMIDATVSPDQRLVVTQRSATAQLDVWDAPSGQPITHFPLGVKSPAKPCFSLSGDTLAVRGAGGRIEVWSTDDWKLRLTLTGHEGNVAAVAFSPGGRQLASAGADEMIRLWNVQSFPQQIELLRHSSEIIDIENLPTRSAYAVLASGNKMWILDTNRNIALPLQAAPTRTACWAISPDGSRLAARDGLGRIAVFDTSNGSRVRTSQDIKTPIRDICYGPDSGTIYVSTRKRGVLAWEIRHDKISEFWSTAKPLAGRLAFCPREKLLIIGTGDGQVFVGDPTREKVRKVARSELGVISGIRLSPDSTKLAISFRNGHIALQKWPELEPIVEFEAHSDRIHSVDFSPDGLILISTSRSGEVKFWNGESGQLQAIDDAAMSKQRVVRFRDDGLALVTGTQDGLVLQCEPADE